MQPHVCNGPCLCDSLRLQQTDAPVLPYTQDHIPQQPHCPTLKHASIAGTSCLVTILIDLHHLGGYSKDT